MLSRNTGEWNDTNKPVQRYIGFSDVLIKELTSSSNKYFIYNMIYNNQLR